MDCAVVIPSYEKPHAYLAHSRMKSEADIILGLVFEVCDKPEDEARSFSCLFSLAAPSVIGAPSGFRSPAVVTALSAAYQDS